MPESTDPTSFGKTDAVPETTLIHRRGFLKSTGAMALSGFTLSGCFGPDRTIIAEAGSVWWNAPMLVARENGFMEQQGLDVTSFDVPTGLESKNAIVSKNADFGVVASTPLVTAAANDEDILVLGSYMTSTSLIGVVHPAGSNLEELLKDPEVGDIAYTKGTISDFYFRKLLQGIGIEKSDNLVNVPPPGTIPAVVGGETVAAVAFEPFLTLAVAEGRKQDKSLVKSVTSNLYELRSYLITSSAYYNENTEIAQKMTAAYAAACADIVARSDHWKTQMTDRFGFPEGFLDDTWGGVDFAFSTDKTSMKATLAAELELAKAAGIPGLNGLQADVFDKMLAILS